MLLYGLCSTKVVTVTLPELVPSFLTCSTRKLKLENSFFLTSQRAPHAVIASMKMAFNVGAVLRRGDFSDTEKPTIDSRSESIVATTANFIGGGAPNEWM
jgi:hypothetical protein